LVDLIIRTLEEASVSVELIPARRDRDWGIMKGVRILNRCNNVQNDGDDPHTSRSDAEKAALNQAN
jgi:hypothetical protein